MLFTTKHSHATLYHSHFTMSILLQEKSWMALISSKRILVEKF